MNAQPNIVLFVASDLGYGDVGCYENTLLVFTTDHGGHHLVADNGPLNGAKGSLHEGGHRIPAIAHWPGRIEVGRVVNDTAMLMDLFPTFTDLCGLQPPSTVPFDGLSLSPLLLQGTPLSERTLFWRMGEQNAVRRGPWKLLNTPTDGVQLFNLDLGHVAVGPHELVVKGDNELRVQDVLIGDVWLASGQSNMQFLLSGAQGADVEMAAPSNPMIRHFKVAVTPSLDPLVDCRGQWEVAEPDTVANFTAVGYFFAKSLQQELEIPIGIINASLGGTAAESWTSIEGMCLPNHDNRAGRGNEDCEIQKWQAGGISVPRRGARRIKTNDIKLVFT